MSAPRVQPEIEQLVESAPAHRRFLGSVCGWKWIFGFIGVVLLIRLALLAFVVPYALVEDEAHYWEWSRHLDWSYYSKGPGVAWVIAMTTAILGDSELGVRASAPVFGAVLALACAKAAEGASGDIRSGMVAAILVTLAPAYQVTSLVMTIDGPYLACWAVGCWGAARAIVRDKPSGWLVLGGAIGLGFLFKYTILLLPAGVLLAAVLQRGSLAPKLSRAPWIISGLALALLGLAPVIIWNSANDWVTVRHLLGHLGVAGGDVPREPGSSKPYSPLWTLEMLGVQLIIAAAIPVLAIDAIRRTYGRDPSDQMRRAVRLWALIGAAPLGFYFIVTFFTRGEHNWPIAAHVSLAMAAAVTLPWQMDRFAALRASWFAAAKPRKRAGMFRRRPELPGQVLWDFTWIPGLIIFLVLPRLDLIPGIPLGRLLRGPDLAADVREKLAALQDTPHERTLGSPLVICNHYGRASLLAFYLRDLAPDPQDPLVFCASASLEPIPELGISAGRKTQYDYWDSHDLWREQLLGRDVVLVGGAREQWEPHFTRVTELAESYRLDRASHIGRRFKGLGSPEHDASDARDPSGSGG